MHLKPLAPKSSLRFHLVVLVLLAIVPALALLFATAAEQRRQATDEAQTNALQLARRTAADYEQIITGTQPLLIALTHLPSVLEGDVAACNARLTEMLAYYPIYANLGVVAGDGTLVCSARPSDGAINVADRSYFQRAMATSAFAVGDYQMGRATGLATLNVAYPIVGSAGDPRGVVFAALQLGGITQTLQNTQLPAGGTLTLLDEHGVVVDRLPDGAGWLGTSVSGTPLGRRVIAWQEGAAALDDLDGTTRLMGFAPIADTSRAGTVYIAVGLPYAAAYADANRLLLWNLGTLGVVAALAVAAAWVGGHFFIVRRVHAIIAATRRLRAGDLTARTGVPDGPGELTLLAQAVDAMAATLQTRQAESAQAAAEIQALNASLERRVAERTSQLQAAKDTVEQERGTLEAIMTSMSDGLIVLDADGRVRYANARVGELVGLDAGQFAGQPSEALFANLRPAFAQPEKVRAAWQRALAHVPERPSFEICVAGPPQRDLLAQLVPVVDVRRPGDGVGVVLRDVTHERELVRAKDELVSVVSHELRTPLASLVGFAELLLMRSYSEEQQRQYLTVMLQEGRRLTALINDFLDLQRMESGRQQVSPTVTDVQTLLSQAIETVGDDPERPIQLTLPDEMPPVHADPDRIQQVLANLLSNARKYSPAGGVIEVTVEASADVVTIAIRDHGLGLPADALPRLFEKFYRVDNSDRRAIKGTGLGLAIVKQLVDAHGGRVWAESAGLGQGARFVFTLPCAAVSALHGDVLIVEDDAGFARLLEAELGAQGHSTVRVPSAEAAITQLAVDVPRVVLLDLMLPGMQGEVFLRRLRLAGGAEVPVIVVTVKDLDHAARQALAAEGVVAVLRKGPGIAAEVARAVSQALGVREAVLA